ncbi:hypothetical protein Leryth_008015 [Lithospermum erythrorhizon]|nr:hypothetical protein Leryth_008015 [Lithospermum erythrorhizon]
MIVGGKVNCLSQVQARVLNFHNFQFQPQKRIKLLNVVMARVYVGNLDPRVSERDLEDEFRIYGVLRSVWVARRPPGYAFIEFDDRRDAMDAIRALDGKNGWRVELSHNSKDGGRGRGRGGDDSKCCECGVQVMGGGVTVLNTVLVGGDLLGIAASLPVVGVVTADHHPHIAVFVILLMLMECRAAKDGCGLMKALHMM